MPDTEGRRPHEREDRSGEELGQPLARLILPQEPRLTSDVSTWTGNHLSDEVSGRNAFLTPVFGPECARHPNDQPESVFRDGQLWQELAGDDELHLFLGRVLEQRLDGRQQVPSRSDPLVTRLRATLLCCAHKATAAYAGAWSDQRGPIENWATHCVHLVEGVRGELLGALQRAIDAAEALDTRTHPLLGAGSIPLRLTGLKSEIRSGQLRGRDVEWLTDLLWHTLIFDSPCYPRTDELALQVSLVVGGRDRPWHRYEPSGMVHRPQDLANFADVVGRCVARGFRVQDIGTVRAGFHGALAELLHTQYLRWDGDRMNRPLPLAVTGTFDLEIERALALTAPVGGAYHVAFPVFVSTTIRGRGELRWIVGTFPALPADAARPSPRLCRALTLPRAQGSVDPHWQWLDELTPPLLGPVLRGPLLLKVNGSPLHRVKPNIEDNDGLRLHRDSDVDDDEPRRWRDPDEEEGSAEPDDATVHHATIVAEFDVLQVMHLAEWSYGVHSGSKQEGNKSATRQGLPAGILDALRHEDRYWLMLGHELSDWNGRLQLFLQVMLAGAESEGDFGALVVSREIDADRAAILDALGISRTKGEYAALTGELRTIIDRLQNGAR